MSGGPTWTEAEDRAVRSLKPDEYNVWARQNGVPLRGAVAGRTPARCLPLGGRLACKIGIAFPV